MSSLARKTGAGLALLLLVMVAMADVKVGRRFPELDRFFPAGSLPGHLGKVVLIDFWASWCSPCKASFPAYSKLQREFAGQGLVVIGVSVDQQKYDYDIFLKKTAPAFATARDASHVLVAEVGVPVMPTSYLVDRNGMIRSVHPGFHGDRTMRELHDEIAKLLEEKS